MSQHDYTIANDTGANVRTDLNNVLGAIVTGNSGATAPSTTYAYQIWVQVPASGRKLIWQRNAANTAWFCLGEADATPLQGQGMVVAQDTPDMTVKVQALKLNTASRTVVTQAAQNTGTITAPGSNSRKDLVCIDRESGAVSVVTGTASASPADPEIPDGKIPFARVNLTSATTAITNADIDDLRSLAMVNPAMPDPRKTFDVTDDFDSIDALVTDSWLIGTMAWDISESGSGSEVDVGDPGFDISGNPGVVTFDTGTGSTGFAQIHQLSGVGTTGLIALGGGRWEFEALVRIEDLPSAAQNFTIRFGLRDAVLNSTPANAVEIVVPAHSSTDYQVRTRSGGSGTDTSATTGVAVAADTWTRLRIVVNAAGTEVLFYVNDTLIHTATTNIPTGNGKTMGLSFGILKSAGSTERKCYLDYVRVKRELTTRR